MTHSHTDHVSGIGPIHRHYKAPIYIKRSAYNDKPKVFEKCELVELQETPATLIGDFIVEPFPTKHDTPSFGYYVTDWSSKRSVCLITDTGFITPLMKKYASKADVLMLEADYDVTSLEEFEEYPDFLKARIASDWGHLSNEQSTKFIRELLDEGKKFLKVVFIHMSVRTNSEELLMNQVEKDIPEILPIVTLAPTTKPIDLDE